MSVNRVVLVGRLTRDPEMKYSTTGTPIASMGIAVNRYSKNEAGEYDVDFFNIVAFNRTAEFAQSYLKKGSLVGVDGRLQTRSWTDQATGQKRTAYEVVADTVQGLGSRQDNMAGGEAPVSEQPPVSSTPPRTTPTTRTAPQTVPDEDEADPFAD